MDLVEFEWEVHEETYGWVEASQYSEVGCGTESSEYPFPRGSPYLITSYLRDDWPRMAPPTRESRKKPKVLPRRYRPLTEYTGLFRTFANTRPRREDVLAFAKRFGHLGVNDVVTFHDGKTGRIIKAQAEPLVAWRSHINLLSYVLTALDRINRGDVAALERYMKERGDGSLVYNPRPEQAFLEDEPTHMAPMIVRNQDRTPARFLSKHANKTVDAALQFIQKVVNTILESRCHPALLLDRGVSDVGLHIVPRDLAGALWLQCAQAVGGNRSYVRCGACAMWFEVSPATRRRNSVYCSQACRLKAYRDRIRMARSLAKEGVSIEEISKRLGSDTATVRGWLKDA